MAITIIGVCLAGIGLWQSLAALADWPGLSLAGTRRGLRAIVGMLLLALGGALAISADRGALTILLLLAPGAIVGFFFCAVVVAFMRWRKDPVAALLTPDPSELRRVDVVSIPVWLPHLHPAADALVAPTSLVTQRDAQKVTPPVTHDTAAPGTLFSSAGNCDRAVLLLCGAGDNRHAFKWPLVRELNARGISVLSMDPPGHGDFMAVPTTVENTQAAARAGLDWLAKSFPGASLGAIGISFGGNQAAWLAAHDARVSALALISTPMSLKPVRRRTILAEAAAMLLPANLRVFRWGSAVDFYRGWRSMKGYAAGPETLYAMVDRFETARDVAGLGGCPILVVHGRSDTAVPFSNAGALQAAAPRAELLPVTHGTHLTIILRPEVAARIAAWFSGKLGAAGLQPVAQSSV